MPDLEKSEKLQDFTGFYQILCQYNVENPEDIFDPLRQYAEQIGENSQVLLAMAKVFFQLELYPMAAELYVKVCSIVDRQIFHAITIFMT